MKPETIERRRKEQLTRRVEQHVEGQRRRQEKIDAGGGREGVEWWQELKDDAETHWRATYNADGSVKSLGGAGAMLGSFWHGQSTSGLGASVTEYRGWTIAPVDGVQLGYRTPTGNPGKGRRSKGYYAKHPVEHPNGKFVSTVAEGKAYIDSYEGGPLGAFELREKFPVENGVTVITQSLPLSGSYAIEAYPNGSGFRLTSVSGKQVLAHADTVAALEKWAKKNGAKRAEFIG